MQNPHHLTLLEQRRLLEQRGITFLDNKLDSDITKIQEIGFYKIKEFAQFYKFRSENSSPQYHDVNFGDILTRYYQDKNLRMHILHASETIEIFLNNQITNILGKKYGAFGYLDFKNWADRRRFNKFKIEEKQYHFKKNLLKRIKVSNLPDIKNKNNLDNEGFPTVWVMVNCLTYGDSVHIVEDMSYQNRLQVAKSFKCTPNELISWLKCLNFIRNVCAHHNDLIDISLKTKPQPPKKYKKFLFKTGNQYTNKIAIAILIIKQIMSVINPKYSFQYISDALKRLINSNDQLAYKLGFNDKSAIDILKKNN